MTDRHILRLVDYVHPVVSVHSLNLLGAGFAIVGNV